MPVAQDALALVHVVDRVDADERVEAAVVEGQRLARVDANEAGALGEPCRAAAALAAATPSSWRSTPVTRQPVSRTMNRAGPPDPLATLNTLVDASRPSACEEGCGTHRRFNHQFWPISSPRASERMAASRSSAKLP